MLAPLSALVVAVAAHAPAGVLTAVAAVALIPTFAGAAASALAQPRMREAAGVTLVVAASGLTLAGIGAAFWSLVAGAVMVLVERVRAARHGDGG